MSRRALALALPVESESAKGSESERKGDWTLGASGAEKGRGNKEEWRYGLEVFGVAPEGRMVGEEEDMVINWTDARPKDDAGNVDKIRVPSSPGTSQSLSWRENGLMQVWMHP